MVRRALLALPAVVVAVLAALPLAGVMAQTPDPQAPVVVYQNIYDGDVLDEMPLSIQLCFAEPINIKDLDKGGDFEFQVRQPDGIGLGHRDIFQPDGYGVAVQPGNPVGDNLTGEWEFTWRVTSPDAEHVATGSMNYTVDPEGEPAPRVSPLACVATGGTATASPVGQTPGPIAVTPSGAPTPAVTAEPTPGPNVDGSPTPAVTREAVDEGDGDGPDILTLALVTLGITGGAAFVALVGYFVRRRVGFEPHKPKGDGGGGHH